MSDFKPRRCRECGEGMIQLLAREGRKMPFRHMAALSVPATLEIPTCTHCGSEWIGPQTAKALDESLAAAYARELHTLLDAALETLRAADVSQRRLEQLMGLSDGYLSRLRGNRGVPSAQLVSTLALLAKDPARRLKELDRLWSEPAVTA